MENKYCRFCGAPLPDDAAFCAKCGKSISTLNKSDSEETKIQAVHNHQTVTRNNFIKKYRPNNTITISANETIIKKTFSVFVILLAIVLIACIGYIMWLRLFPKEFPTGINTSSVKGEAYYKWKRKLPHVSKIVDNCHQYGYTGSLTSNTQLDTIFFLAQSDKLGILYDWELNLDSGKFQAHGEDTKKAMNCLAQAIGYEGDISNTLDEFAEENKTLEGVSNLNQVSPRSLTNSVAVRCMWTLGDRTTSYEGMGRFMCTLTEETVADKSPSPRITSNSPSPSANSNTPSPNATSNNFSSGKPNRSNNTDNSSKNDFTDLWKSVIGKENLTKIADTYCRKDGTCVTITANSAHEAGDYDTSWGTISYSGSSSSNPLPGAAKKLDLTSAAQDPDSSSTVPSSPTVIGLMAANNNCSGDSEADCTGGVDYVMPGLDASNYFLSDYDSGNPPSASKDYLVIGWGTKVSDNTVFYRK